MIKLLVDGATGSAELVAPLKALGLPVVKTHLEFGDLAFMGRGEKGAPLYVGIELKTVSDLAQSLVSKRFQGHQLIGLTKDFDRRYLVVEGDFSHDLTGRTVRFKRDHSQTPMHGLTNAVGFETEILNMQTRGGLWVRHTNTRKDTLRFIHACFRYWTDKDLDEHKSHLAMYAPDLDRGLLTPPTDFRKALAVLLPGVEMAVSKAIEDKCGGVDISVRRKLQRVLNFTVSDWASITTSTSKGKLRKLGKNRAEAIMEALR